MVAAALFQVPAVAVEVPKECKAHAAGDAEIGEIHHVLTETDTLKVYEFQPGDIMIPKPLSSGVFRFDCTAHGATVLFYERIIHDQLIPLEAICNEGHSLIVDAQSDDIIYYSFTNQGDIPVHLSITACDLPKVEPLEELAKLETDKLKDTFAEESFLQISGFLTDDFASSLIEELNSRNQSQPVGPFDYRKFTLISEEASLPSGLAKLKTYFKSPLFRASMAELTGLDLEGLQLFQVRVLTGGDFQILNDEYMEPLGLDVVLTLSAHTKPLVQDGGEIFYLVDGEKVAGITPVHNQLSLAYRVEGCTRFMAYISRTFTETIYQIHMNFRVANDKDEE